MLGFTRQARVFNPNTMKYYNEEKSVRNARNRESLSADDDGPCSMEHAEL
jgi:hypothetical protein